MIRFESVTKDYGDLKALDGVSFEVEPGGILGLLGPNGAGKTTIMRIMTGYLAATAGTVTFDGQEFGPGRADLKRHIGYLPESAPLYNDMIAWDYLIWEARLHGLDGKQRVPEVIRMTGLDSHAHKPIRELSKGYRQRVGLAHTLLHDPRILVLDEPTSGLDPNQILEVRELIRRIAGTKTVVLSTHIMQEVEALCDRVIVIDHGKIRYDGSIGEFSAGAAHGGAVQRVRVVARGIAEDALRQQLLALPGVVAVESFIEDDPAGPLTGAMVSAAGGADLRPAIFHAAKSQGPGGEPAFELWELSRERTSLEQIFQELTNA